MRCINATLILRGDFVKITEPDTGKIPYKIGKCRQEDHPATRLVITCALCGRSNALVRFLDKYICIQCLKELKEL